MRFNPAPGWPPPPEGFTPDPGWQPDPSWPPAPAGWQLWVPATGQTPTEIGQGLQQAPGLPGYPRQTMPGTWQPAPRQPSGTSGMAIAAFVLGLASASILAIIFGSVALSRIRRTNQGGRGFAIAGIVLGSVWLVVSVGLFASFVIRGGSGPATPSVASSLTPEPGSLGVKPWTLKARTCFDMPAITPGKELSVPSIVPILCTQPHSAQIFATFDVSGGLLSYPGAAKMSSLADSGCTARAPASLDSAKVTDSMTIQYLYPLESTWLGGVRTVTCVVINPTPTLTSSVLKS